MTRALLATHDFWHYTALEPFNGCLFWTAALQSMGYGKIWFEGKPQLAHRVAYQLTFGPIPEGKHILHNCDTPACVNPEHLFVGDPKANALDKSRKGRAKSGHENQTHCKRGHLLSGSNMRLKERKSRNGKFYKVRCCLTCLRDASLRSQQRSRNKQLSKEC